MRSTLACEALHAFARRLTRPFGPIDMTPLIQLVRHPYEEPYHLNLVIMASNGSTSGSLEFYINASELVEWANAMETFPNHQNSVHLIELGSERPEDRWAYYFRMRFFTIDSAGHCAIQFRFNNNSNLPEREISEFCIVVEAAQINRLGVLVRKFAKLNDYVLRWSAYEGELFDSMSEAEQAIPADRGESRSR